MNNEERILDIVTNDKHGIGKNELETVDSDHCYCFRSIQYHEIIHYTDAELYYLGDETQTYLDDASDLILNTVKGRIYLFK